MKRRPPDRQAKKVFAAENKVNQGRRMETVSEMQAWVDKITKTCWWKNRSSFSSIRVMPGRGCKNALAAWSRPKGNTKWIPTIKMPKWARSEFVILHELSHHLVDPDPYDRQYANHGPEFCRMLIAMIKRWMGQDIAEDLRHQFSECGVKTRSKRIK